MNFDKNSSEDYLRKGEEFMNRFSQSPAGIFTITLIIILFFAVPSSFYTVQPEEEAVVTFFGRYDRTTGPGLHLKIPFAERAIRIKTKTIFEEAFGFYSKSSTVDKRFDTNSPRKLDEESLMLTGDLNVADVQWVVQYRISDPRKFLFHISDPIKNIRDVSQATMRRVVGDRTVDDVIRGTELEVEAQNLTQEILDAYDIGLNITSVQIKAAFPPEEVKPSFNEVNAAKQEQEQAINEAEAYYNEIIPKARGEADKVISEATGKAVALVNEAQGDASRFESVLAEYRKAPDVTKKRLYLETMQELLGRFRSVTIVDPSVKGVLPVFSGTDSKAMSELKRPNQE